MHFLDKEFAPAPVIVGIDWYNGLEGHTDRNAPTLALALQHGKIQVQQLSSHGCFCGHLFKEYLPAVEHV